MDAKFSEGLFASYLESHNLNFERHFQVYGEKNVDFKINTPVAVLCDVKEVHDSRADSKGSIDAYTHIREDLKDLRKKFGRNKPTCPVVLISMNFSSSFFTGFTVAQAMFGDVGAVYTGKALGDLHHLPRGNASMTRSSNTSISGILVFDCASSNHTYFPNEFARTQLHTGYFPYAVVIDLKRDSPGQEVVRRSDFMFWGYNENNKL